MRLSVYAGSNRQQHHRLLSNGFSKERNPVAHRYSQRPSSFATGNRKVQNYAIVGNTLWVFNERRTRKILLSELNVPATQKVNEERGIEFSVPR